MWLLHGGRIRSAFSQSLLLCYGFQPSFCSLIGLLQLRDHKDYTWLSDRSGGSVTNWAQALGGASLARCLAHLICVKSWSILSLHTNRPGCLNSSKPKPVVAVVVVKKGLPCTIHRLSGVSITSCQSHLLFCSAAFRQMAAVVQILSSAVSGPESIWNWSRGQL